MLYYGSFRCPCMQERKELHITLNGTLRQYECPTHPIMALMPDLRYHVRNNGTSPTIENKTGAGILNYIAQYMLPGRGVGGGGGGWLSGTEGGLTRLTYFAEEGVFSKTSECPRFCIRRYFL